MLAIVEIRVFFLRFCDCSSRPAAILFLSRSDIADALTGYCRNSVPEKRLSGKHPDSRNSTIFCCFPAGFAEILQGCSLFHFFPCNQYSLAPAGMCGSTIRRWSFSSSPSVWTAEMSMPQDSMPIIFLGGRFVIAMQVFPISASGS